ncbi:MAG: hypothetical protein C5S47_04405 [Candidatus Methanogasteraceae archaeon]|nr:MAG: hypothetical protein C5S47_04405 [ANME-2 cluster archaeon]
MLTVVPARCSGCQLRELACAHLRGVKYLGSRRQNRCFNMPISKKKRCGRLTDGVMRILTGGNSGAGKMFIGVPRAVNLCGI